MKLVYQLMVIAKVLMFTKDIANLVETKKEVYFHDQLVLSNMEIIERLILRNDISNITILGCVGEEIHIAPDMVRDLHIFIDISMDVELDALIPYIGCDDKL